MEDFKDRTDDELLECYPLFVDALKEEYDVIMNIIDIIFSSCSIMTKTEKPCWNGIQITCEVFECFFEYQIYKIMEKYRYYREIRNQALQIEHKSAENKYRDININVFAYLLRLRKSYTMYVGYCCDDKIIEIKFNNTIYRIEVHEKYQKDMMELFSNHCLEFRFR